MSILRFIALCLAMPFLWSCAASGSIVQDQEQKTPASQESTQMPSRKLKTIQLYPTGNPMAPPYLELGSGNSLTLHFDDLAGGYENYQYRLVHCDHFWEASDLPSNNYIRGFQTASIENMEQSFNTMLNYTHYWAEFPNNMQEILLSGNYKLEIYTMDDEETVIAVKRFVVYEQIGRFRPMVKEPTVISERRYKQEVDFDFLPYNYDVVRPYEDLHMVVLQNHRWDNAIFDLKPVFVKGDEIIYNHDEENNFDGLNEYRFLDLKDLRFNAINMDSIKQYNDGWHAFLRPSDKRAFDVYRTDQDINGRFLVKNDRFDDHLESEYLLTHFKLNMDYVLSGAEVCIVGDAFGYHCHEENTLQYNSVKKQYEGNILVKQGYYNWMYAVQYPHEAADISVLEGTHWATNNEYTVIAYYADPVGYDRVIGILFTDNQNR